MLIILNYVNHIILNNLNYVKLKLSKFVFMQKIGLNS